MNRYFLEVAYCGDRYAGFQVQDNAPTVQSEVEKALFTYFRVQVGLTGASRTDTGVHALRNYFHADMEQEIPPSAIYNLNAILPDDIVIKNIIPVMEGRHCRFDAISRTYKYFTYQQKDPFLKRRAFYFPYTLDEPLLHEAAAIILGTQDFSSFSKRNTQARTTICSIHTSEWIREQNCLIYHIVANRFLRGMVRGLTGTMLRVGRGKLSVEEFRQIIASGDSALADFSVPGHGLFLVDVRYPDDYFRL